MTTAVRGSEALDRIRGARFDGIVLDVMLPDVDGFTICETMRLEGNITPVLFLTARTLPQERIRGLRSGEDYLGKPFELEELLLRVRKLMARSVSDNPEQWTQQALFRWQHGGFRLYDVRGQREWPSGLPSARYFS